MEHIVFANEMKEMDEATSLELGIDSFTLMERAALETAHFIKNTFGVCKIGVLCGTGNNGGDGLALGRILWEFGYDVEMHLIGNAEHASDLVKKQLAILEKHGLSVKFGIPTVDFADIWVDSLFGIGLNRTIEGIYYDAISFMNNSSAKKIAIDIPSGVHADCGTILGIATKCDYTITYGAKKVGQILFPGAVYCGEIICASIGIPTKLFDKKDKFIFDKSDVQLPGRKPDGNKGTFGKVLLIAGSKQMPGASLLSSMAALRIGSGMVKLYSDESNMESVLKALPEVMFSCYSGDNAKLSIEEENKLLTDMDWCNVIAMGPGMGTNEKAYAICKFVLSNNRKPIIIDADACNLIAMHDELFELISNNDTPVIFTPHIGEFARLLHSSVMDVKNDWIKKCIQFSKDHHAILVCKDARTIVTDGNELYFNVSGNDGMATAGSGDVLTGMIAGLVAQSTDYYKMSCLGTFLHGLAGDIAKQNTSAYYIIAQDLIHALSNLL